MSVTVCAGPAAFRVASNAARQIHSSDPATGQGSAVSRSSRVCGPSGALSSVVSSAASKAPAAGNTAPAQEGRFVSEQAKLETLADPRGVAPTGVTAAGIARDWGRITGALTVAQRHPDAQRSRCRGGIELSAVDREPRCHVDTLVARHQHLAPTSVQGGSA